MAESDEEFEYGEEELPETEFDAAEVFAPVETRDLPTTLPAPKGERLTKSYTRQIAQEMQRCMDHPSVYYVVDYVDDEITHWQIDIKGGWDESSNLATTLKQHKIATISLDVKFTVEFPMTPPKILIISPTIEGDHLISGAFCHEMLTGGWKSVYTIDAVIVQLVAFMSEYGQCTSTAKMDQRAAHDSWKSLNDHSWGTDVEKS